MRGQHYGTMNQGYYYDEAKKQGYTISVGNLYFSNVSYHSKGQLIRQLTHDGYKKSEIIVEKDLVV
jgi:hypothetical protein